MLYLYTLEGREIPDAKKSVRYVLSKEGRRIITEAGFVPLLTPPASTERSIAP
jgi:ABC-type Fe3+ transport system substrate-binding protein